MPHRVTAIIAGLCFLLVLVLFVQWRSAEREVVSANELLVRTESKLKGAEERLSRAQDDLAAAKKP